MTALSVGRVSLYIDEERCSLCRRCLAQKVCKVKAIVRLDPDEPPFIDVHRCYSCMLCLLECPFEAVIAV